MWLAHRVASESYADGFTAFSSRVILAAIVETLDAHDGDLERDAGRPARHVDRRRLTVTLFLAERVIEMHGDVCFMPPVICSIRDACVIALATVRETLDA